MSREIVVIDGNEAAAYVAYNLSEVIAIYPITPSSNMGEWADEWASKGLRNIWGAVPDVMEMQSEGGAAGAVHGALQAGALSTTFTASQGLLLMIPNMFKIAGELTPTVFHISARALASHALSIFGDHSDVMTCRQTGFAMLCSGSVQEVMDLALIAHSATLDARIPFMHFFDGFRTSHELLKVEKLSAADMQAMINQEAIYAHRNRALSPDHPVMRGTAQNPDVFFQSREACNKFYMQVPSIVQGYMDKFAKLVGRQYHLFDYVGASDAERVIVVMGSGAEVTHEAVDYLNAHGEKVGVLKVRLFRPFVGDTFVQAIPQSVKSIAVLDRTKEPGALGEPLYQDVITAYSESGRAMPKIVGGRYGLSSKEFTPAMVKGVFDELKKSTPKNHFTVGIVDDVTNLSLDYDEKFSSEDEGSFRAIFIGLGSDGTVGANKNSIKIIGEATDFVSQAYFVYDSKKSGSITRSYLRFGKNAIRSSYLTKTANFIGCHQFSFTEKIDLLADAQKGATFLLNAPFPKEEIWNHLPKKLQEDIIAKEIKFYVIDAYSVAKEIGMGDRINTIMQTCFFEIANVIPAEQAISDIKTAIKKTYGKRGEEVVKKNWKCVDMSRSRLFKVEVPATATSNIVRPPVVSAKAPEFVQKVTAQIMAGDGDKMPVSLFPVDGTYPTATTKWEKRNISLTLPAWDADVCIQCGKCAVVCPHAVVRMKIYDKELLKEAPQTFKSAPAKAKEFGENKIFTIQMAPEDCTGCELCVEVCPAKNKSDTSKKALYMVNQAEVREEERKNFEFFEQLPYIDRTQLKRTNLRDSQLMQPLFEFSGACQGCGETPYIKLISQLFGDRMVIANATGCTSIYGGNLPTTPYCQNNDGRGPAWSNSLFEDNAEFGLGMRLAILHKNNKAKELAVKLKDAVGEQLVNDLVSCEQSDEGQIKAQRERIDVLKAKLATNNAAEAKELLSIADYLAKKSVWIIGGDGWAYDIGYGGLDHVLASGHNVNVLLLDTEVYSNTGGQMSKATPIGAVAKFAAGGKSLAKKDIGLLAMSYGNIYVARVAFGANDSHALKALVEAENYNGPSLVICYSHCIAHGYNLKNGLVQQKLAVDSAYWPLYRYNPELAEKGENPFLLDSKDPKVPLKDYIYNETRYRMLTQANPERAEKLLKKAQAQVSKTWKLYKDMAERKSAAE
ncbi:MAG: pyruvate:ferredoxin (flavodoxin) oxidoreductase [Deltaproteobacteria bacterium]|nr:pyruvate:ferredoxin (flavodoxin) oxidoreductase [Deltaproteobacteria bacterium]